MSQFIGEGLHPVIGQGNRLGIERVGFNDVCPCAQVFEMNISDYLRTCEIEEVIVALEVPLPILETFATEILFSQLAFLNHRSHGSVNENDAFPEKLAQCCFSVLYPLATVLYGIHVSLI